jgi:RND superfamily putative drug exporter
LFDGLAKFIIRRHKAIVVIWLIIFLCALPFLNLVNKVIVYQESEVSPLNTASQMSQQVINEEFPSLLPKSSAVIVIRGTDVNSSDMRDYLLAFEGNITRENSTGKLHRVTSVLTLYSVYRTRILEPVILMLAPMLDQARGVANNTTFLLFALPTQFYQNYTQLNLTQIYQDYTTAAAQVYNVPALFLEAWNNTDPGWDNATRTSDAYNHTVVNLTQTEGQYLLVFRNSWLDVLNGSTSYPDDVARAQAAAEVAAKIYYPLDINNTSFDEVKYYALSNMTIADYNDSAALSRWSGYYASENTTTRVLNYLISPLNGTTYLTQLIYLATFSRVWEDSFDNASTAGLSPLERAEYSKNVSVPEVLANYSGALPPEAKDIVNNALQQFDLTDWRDAQKVNNFTLDAVSSLAAKQFNFTVPTWFLKDVQALGPDATSAQAEALATLIVRDNIIAGWPVPMPAMILNTFIDSSNKTMLAVVGFNGDPADLQIQSNVVEIRSVLHTLIVSRPQWHGYTTYLTGVAGIDYDMRSSAEADARLIEPFTAVLVVVFIALYFRSAVAPWGPLVTVGMAFVMSQAVMYLIGTYVAGIHYSIRLVVFTMIMGAGSDYCIFIASRFREERLLGKPKQEAIRIAIVWAGESIATSGATVMMAFLALAIFSFPLVQVMGLCLAVSIGITLLMALTLIPSLLYWLGDWVFWPTMGEKLAKYRLRMNERMKNEVGYFFSAAKASLKHPGAIVGICLLISVPTTYLVFSIEPSYDFLGSMANVEAKKGVDAMTQGFGAGSILPTYVVIQYDTLIWDNATHSFDSKKLDATDGLAGALSNMSSVFKVTSSAYNSLSGQRIDLAKNWTAAELLLSLGATNRTVMLTVVLRDQPFSSKAVHEITDIRAECQGYKDRHPELSTAEVLIGGSTAGTADIGATVTHDFPISAALVLIGVYVILLLVLGSVLIPLRLMLTILLSISWTLALAFMIFTWWLSIPVLWILPILLFVILMGLGMDYDIFLMTRVKEEVMRGKSDEDAIAHAVEHTGGIITICGVIMAGAFGTMMLSSTGLLEEFGFGLSFAILLDAIIVRIYLVPAIMVLLKKWNWWAPFGLQKVRRETDGKGAGDSEE